MQFMLSSHIHPASYWQSLWPPRDISAETGECKKGHSNLPRELTPNLQ